MGLRRASAAGALAAGAAALLAVLASAGDEPQRGELGARTLPLRPLMPAGARRLHDRSRAVSALVPPGWHRTRANVAPRMADPRPIVTVATFPARVARRAICGSSPDIPHVEFGADDALLIVTEELGASPGHLPRRPRRFALARSPFPCLARRGFIGFRRWFRAHGRWLELTAVAGERTPKRMRRTLLGVAESLRFGPTPPVKVRVEPPEGRPRTRFRLELTSTHPTARQGRRERVYWAAVEGPHKVACVIQNEAWFSHGPPGARLRAVLDPNRTKGNRWCRGRFTGILRYRDAICDRRGPCERTYLRRAGHFSFTVR